MANSSLTISFTLINAENLFLLFDQPLSAPYMSQTEAEWQKNSTSIHENKSLRKTVQLAKTLSEINSDIVMLCEVGGLESLTNFNKYFLNDAYYCALLDGNSERGIDVGFLISKKLESYFDIASNKNRLINFLYPHERQSLANGYTVANGKPIQSHKFSRDVVELKLFKHDKEKPSLIILLTHLKSPLDRDRIDPQGVERREAELKALIEIYLELEEKYQSKIPILVAGDFNGNAGAIQTDREFVEIYKKTQLKDVLDLENISLDQRATFYNIRGNGKVDGRQIDFCFLSPLLQSQYVPQSASVYRYRDEFGFAINSPLSLDEKLLLPSDHYPLVFKIKS